MFTSPYFKLIKLIDNIFFKYHDKSLLFYLKNELIKVLKIN